MSACKGYDRKRGLFVISTERNERAAAPFMKKTSADYVWPNATDIIPSRKYITRFTTAVYVFRYSLGATTRKSLIRIFDKP